MLPSKELLQTSEGVFIIIWSKPEIEQGYQNCGVVFGFQTADHEPVLTNQGHTGKLCETKGLNPNTTVLPAVP